MKDIKKTIQTVCKKNIVVIIMIIFLCPILAITYATFITNTEGYKASEMYIGNLLYSMKINNNPLSSITVPSGDTEVKVEITSLNSVSSNYILTYDNNPNVTIVYAEDENEPTEGLITTTKTSTLLIRNSSLSNTTISFNIVGGYSTNSIFEIEVPNTQSKIITDYTKFDYNTVTMYINGVLSESLNPNKKYKLTNSVCTNEENVKWDIMTNDLKIENVTNQTKCQLYFEELPLTTTIAQKIYADNTKVASRTDFTQPFVADTTGNIYYTSTNTESVCTSTDSLTYVSGSGANAVCKTYYFAGQTTNNFVSFGGYLWRIVRINEDQSVRLIFQGNINTVGLNSGSQGYTSISNNFTPTNTDNTYLGLFYGTANASTYADTHSNVSRSSIYVNISSWYGANLYHLNSYVSPSSIYCNDRSVISGTGIGKSVTTYGAYDRLVTNKNPQFKCTNFNDKFTKSTTTGNNKLIYPIALLTADESMYAGFINLGGGIGETLNKNYLSYRATSSSSFTMTPYSFNGTNASVFPLHSIAGVNVSSTFIGVRPVISLKACVKYLDGNGTESSPYVVGIDSACSASIK